MKQRKRHLFIISCFILLFACVNKPKSTSTLVNDLKQTPPLENIQDTSNSEDMLPITSNAMVIRTYFENNQAWEALKAEITAPSSKFGFLANDPL